MKKVVYGITNFVAFFQLWWFFLYIFIFISLSGGLSNCQYLYSCSIDFLFVLPPYHLLLYSSFSYIKIEKHGKKTFSYVNFCVFEQYFTYENWKRKKWRFLFINSYVLSFVRARFSGFSTSPRAWFGTFPLVFLGKTCGGSQEKEMKRKRVF